MVVSFGGSFSIEIVVLGVDISPVTFLISCALLALTLPQFSQ